MTSADLSAGPSAPSAAAARRQVHLVELTVMPGVRYSAVLGYLQAAAEAAPDLAEACSFAKHVYMQGGDAFETACAKVLDALDNPLAVAFTVYFWNRPGTLELARRIKERWPRCRIVVGGNDVTHQPVVFDEAPWVDVLVHGEGEMRFRDLLRVFLRHEEPAAADSELGALPGISYRSADGEVVTTAAAPGSRTSPSCPRRCSGTPGPTRTSRSPGCWCTRPTGAAPTPAPSATGAGPPTPRSASSPWTAS